MAYYMQRKSLAGKCGIPFERDQVDVKPVRDSRGGLEAIEFPGGTRVKLAGIVFREEFGREFFGNVRTHVVVRLRGWNAGELDIWEEGCRWFLRKQDIDSLKQSGE